MTPSPAESNFETAVEAIIRGDATGLSRLLEEEPGLVRERSARPHASTLLHYVAANGVEDERQKTPANIVEIARILLDAGADVNAESNAYAGHATTLMLAATSAHPEKAGVQIALLALLLSRGAVIDGVNGSSTVNACLRNGRGHAAEYLAEHGAALDLEGAAGVGRIDLMEGLPLDPEQMRYGFAWACEFGRTEAAEWLLDHGLAIDAKLPNFGNTGLHWAAYGGHPDTVRMLLARGAPIDSKDDKYDGTPLGWAKHGRGEATDQGGFDDVVEQLVRAGATHD